MFWFWTTYLPLDRYGNTTATRLGKIEETLNDQYGLDLDLFRTFAHHWSLFKAFFGYRAKVRWWWALVYSFRRARFFIWIFFLCLHVVVLVQFNAAMESTEPFFTRQSSVGATAEEPFFVDQLTPDNAVEPADTPTPDPTR